MLASKSGSLRNHSSRKRPYSGSSSLPNQNSRTSPALLGTADDRYVFVAAGEGPALHAAAVALYHPQLGHDLRDQLAIVEHPDHGALRDDHGNRARLLGYRSSGHVAAPQPERQVQVVGGGVYVAGRREHHARVRDQKSAVQLGQLLYGLPHVVVFYLLVLIGVALQGVQDQGLRPPHHLARVPDHKERPDLASLAALARYLDRQRDGLLEHPGVDPALLRADLLEYVCLAHLYQPPFCLLP